MGLKSHFSFLVCLLSFAIAILYACEDNPEECYSDEDCGEGYLCEPTYYNSGSRSGGVCKEVEGEEDSGDNDASDDTKKANDAAVQDSSHASTADDASTGTAAPIDAAEQDDSDATLSGDAAADAEVTEAAVEGGQSPQPADGGNVDSAN